MPFVFNNLRYLKKCSGQSTVEAAFMIPVFMVLLLLLIQPAIVCYDLIIMKSASSQACRLVSESGSSGTGGVDDFIRRRLSAIPQVDAFHVHGGDCSYEINIEGANESSATVAIKNKIKPLPLIDLTLRGLGATNQDGCLELATVSTQTSRPSWVG